MESLPQNYYDLPQVRSNQTPPRWRRVGAPPRRLDEDRRTVDGDDTLELTCDGGDVN